ncbi:hypothetical protein ACFYXC_30195 [Streptomyces sp. NPDC002701]|uniref:hypothetical protein n=1 Tax=Streptomyces sp. NPDC002701 TaxID=3364661 RepID=UPI0036BA73E9
MGIESDQLVFDYLSRVGDLAQQRQLPSGTRMRLVSELRSEIDRRRAKAVLDSPAAVRRILDRIGTPESVVAAAGSGSASGAGSDSGSGAGGGTGGGGGGRAAVPPQRAEEPEVRPGRLRRLVPRPRSAEPGASGTAGTASDAGADAGFETAPSPPHLASTEELGSGTQPDWWRVDSGPFGAMDSVPGFVGGVEIPELFEPPPSPLDGEPSKPKAGAVVEPAVPAGAAGVAGTAGPVEAGGGAGGRVRRRFVPRLRPVRGGWANPLLLLAAALLVAGAVVGNLVLLGLGWLIAYLSRRLSPTESKWAVLGVPGLVLAGGVVWLWGRTERRWGAPIVEGEMNAAVAETWPVVLRTAAVASALFLVWRSQRR